MTRMMSFHLGTDFRDRLAQQRLKSVRLLCRLGVWMLRFVKYRNKIIMCQSVVRTYILRRYKLPLFKRLHRSRIAHGAFGEVWKGRWKPLGPRQHVAIKRLFPLPSSLDDYGNPVSLFQDAEIATLARMRHPNLVLFFGAGFGNSAEPCLKTA